MRMNGKMIRGVMAGLVAAALITGCRTLRDMSSRDYSYSHNYTDKVRMLMTEEELKIFDSLPDWDSKIEFIEEFWKMRDPAPGTAENEYRTEILRRIAFANEWFSDWLTFKGKTRGVGQDADRGWRTDKGWIYIVFGHPELVTYDGLTWEPMKLYYENEGRYESWFYPPLRLRVGFYRTTAGVWKVVVTEFLYEKMREAKLCMLSSGYKDFVDKLFKFEAARSDNGIRIRIKPDRVHYEERENRLEAQFELRINVYRDDHREDVLEMTKTLTFDEDELWKMKWIVFEVPYSPKGRGKFLLDVIMSDIKCLSFAKYRTYVKFRQ